MELLTNLYLLYSYDWGILALRIAVGAIFLVHGTQKWAMWKMQPSEQMPQSMLSLIKFLSIVEPLGGIAVLSGFLTQFAATGLGIIMIGAIWFKTVKWGVPFAAQDKTGWEFDLLILAACITILLLGAGVFSVDNILLKI